MREILRMRCSTKREMEKIKEEEEEETDMRFCA